MAPSSSRAAPAGVARGARAPNSTLKHPVVATKVAEEEPCPVCAEIKDVTDMNFTPPCPCGFPVCLFCYHRLRQEEGGRCPACRQPYGALGDTRMQQQQGTPEQRQKAAAVGATAAGSPPKGDADFGGRQEGVTDTAAGGAAHKAMPRAGPKHAPGEAGTAALPSGATWATNHHPPQRAPAHSTAPPPPPVPPAIADASAWPDLAAAAQHAAGGGTAHRHHSKPVPERHHNHPHQHPGPGAAPAEVSSATSSFLSDASQEQQHHYHRAHSHSGSSQSLHDASTQASGGAAGQDPPQHHQHHHHHQQQAYQAAQEYGPTRAVNAALPEDVSGGGGAAHQAGSQLLALLRHGQQHPAGHAAAAHNQQQQQQRFEGCGDLARQQLMASTADSAMLPTGQQLPAASKPQQQLQQHGAGLHLSVHDLFAQQQQHPPPARADSLFGDGSAALFGALAQLQQPPAVKPTSDVGAAAAAGTASGAYYDIWNGGMLLDHHQQQHQQRQRQLQHQRQDSFGSATTLTGYESSSFGSSHGSWARQPSHHLQLHHSQSGHHMGAEGPGVAAMPGGPFGAGPAYGAAGAGFAGKAPPPGFAGLGHLTVAQQHMLFGGALMGAPAGLDAAMPLQDCGFGGGAGMRVANGSIGEGAWFQPSVGHDGGVYGHYGGAGPAHQGYMNAQWH